MSITDQIWNYKKGLKPQQQMQVDLHKPKSLADAMEIAIKVDNSIWSSKQAQLRYSGSKNIKTDNIPMELAVLLIPVIKIIVSQHSQDT
jgi:hypothetical protein